MESRGDVYWSDYEEEDSYKEDDVFWSDCEEENYYSDCDVNDVSFLRLECKCGKVMPLHGSIQCGPRVIHILDYIYLYKTYMCDRLEIEYNCEKCKLTKKPAVPAISLEYFDDTGKDELDQVNENALTNVEGRKLHKCMVLQRIIMFPGHKSF